MDGPPDPVDERALWTCEDNTDGYHVYDGADDDSLCLNGACPRRLAELVGESADAKTPQHATP